MQLPLIFAPHSRLPYRAVLLTGTPGGVYVVVDEIDYDWAMQWRWHVAVSRNVFGHKYYARRWIRIDGKRGKGVWLHKEVCGRHNGPPPTPQHRIGDHRNGNSQDCRRANMRWATDQMNRANLWGVEALQYKLAV